MELAARVLPAGLQKLVFFSNTSWYLWNFRLRMAERLAASGHEVVFLAPPDDYSRRLAAAGRFLPVGLDRKGTNIVSELATLLDVFNTLRREKPCVLLSWTPKANIYGGLACQALRIPYISNIAGLGSSSSRADGLARAMPGLYRVSLRRAATVFFQNGDDRDQLVGAGAVAGERAVQLPGSGVDLARFVPRPLPAREPFRFLYAGRLLGEKGVRELVAAARLLRGASARPFELRVVGFIDPGNPNAISDAELAAWHEEGMVRFRGQSDRVEDELAAAHCVVHPSYYPEGRPRILLEAAASGRAAITTDSTGCRDAVHDQVTGLLVQPRDVQSLAAAMQHMLDMPWDELERMGAAARRLAEGEFSEDIVFACYEKALGAL